MVARRTLRRTRLPLLLTFLLMLGLVVVLPGFALGGSTFESNDGNLASNGETDWNDLVTGPGIPVTLSPTGVGLNYEVRGDPGNSNADVVYRGGRNDAKHDVECPGLTTKKEQNKSDFVRFGIAHEDVNEETFVYLYWLRIDQNSTSASGHASFELNQADPDDRCGGFLTEEQVGDLDVTDPLDAARMNFNRVAGDLMFIYDFAGGPGQSPTLIMHRWIKDGNDGTDPETPLTAADCEVAKALPCWGKGSGDLINAGIADGRVNDASIGPVYDEITGGNLGTVTFGEAAVNFHAAGILSDEGCIGFGQARVSSRSSGNSFEADLKDWVEPAGIAINTCGSITIEKETDPSPNTTDTFNFDIEDEGGTPLAGGTNFALEDGEDKKFDDLTPGTYVATEDDPGPKFALDDIVCTGTDGGNVTLLYDDGLGGLSDDPEDGPLVGVEIDLQDNEDVTCTFVNKLQIASILIVKTDDLDNLLPGAVFELTELDEEALDPVITLTEYEDGIHCADGLTRDGEYTVDETPPDGWTIPTDTGTITATNLATCAERLAEIDDLENPSTSDIVLLADAEVVNSPEPGRVLLTKTDDADNPIAGVEFALHDATYDEVEDEYTIGDATGDTCTTDSDGVCREDGIAGEDRPSFDNLEPGYYCVTEVSSPDDYGTDPDDPHCFEIERGVDGGDTVTVDVVNPRLHKIAVIVCHMGTNSLSPSEVSDDSEPAITIVTPDDATLFGALCASDDLEWFTGLEHGPQVLTVDVSSEDHT